MRALFVVSLALVSAGLASACESQGAAARGLAATGEPAAVRASATDSPRVALGADAQVLYRRTLGRDGAPPCATLTAGLGDPLGALLEVSERVSAPGWSSIRAATCVLRDHAAEAEPHLLRWVHDRRTRGLGLLVLGALDELDEGLAGRVVDSALAGEFADEARERAARSTRYPALRERAAAARAGAL